MKYKQITPEDEKSFSKPGWIIDQRKPQYSYILDVGGTKQIKISKINQNNNLGNPKVRDIIYKRRHGYYPKMGGLIQDDITIDPFSKPITPTATTVGYHVYSSDDAKKILDDYNNSIRIRDALLDSIAKNNRFITFLRASLLDNGMPPDKVADEVKPIIDKSLRMEKDYIKLNDKIKGVDPTHVSFLSDQIKAGGFLAFATSPTQVNVYAAPIKAAGALIAGLTVGQIIVAVLIVAAVVVLAIIIYKYVSAEKTKEENIAENDRKARDLLDKENITPKQWLKYKEQEKKKEPSLADWWLFAKLSMIGIGAYVVLVQTGVFAKVAGGITEIGVSRLRKYPKKRTITTPTGVEAAEEER